MPAIDRVLDAIDIAMSDPMTKEEKTKPSPSMKPLRLCCNAYSLFVGLVLICIGHVILNSIVLSNTSSVEPIELVGIRIRPTTQTLLGTWALTGMPIIVLGAVGSMFRITWALRLYMFYLIGTFLVDSALTLQIFYEADVCTTVVPKSIRKMGTAFVCGYTDMMVFVLLLVLGTVSLYCIWVVWSCLQEIQGAIPALLPYGEDAEEDDRDDRDDLKYYKGPSYGTYGGNGTLPFAGAPAGMQGPGGFAQAPYGQGGFQGQGTYGQGGFQGAYPQGGIQGAPGSFQGTY